MSAIRFSISACNAQGLVRRNRCHYPSSAPIACPSLNFNVLPTDVNNTGNITSYDYVYIRQLDGKSTTSTGYIAKRDVNGDGVINSTDWQEALDRAYQALPSGSPAGTYNDAPTTSGFDLIQIAQYLAGAK